MNLLDAVRRYADARADSSGVAITPISGLLAIRATQPSELQFAINRPLVAIVLGGRKKVAIGPTIFDFGAGDSMVITADVPTVSQITVASRAAPYYALVLELDLAIIRELAGEIGPAAPSVFMPVTVDPTESEVADVAARLMSLLDRPAALPILAGQHLKEMHYWLITGRHGYAIRALGQANGRTERIARAIALIRAGYRRPLRVDDLAEAAGMSLSSFHQHFRAVTTLSPLQFQKQLRLVEARRLMLAEGASASSAAYAVGYESATQFTREYGRLFGDSPLRDMKAMRGKRSAA